MNANLNRRTCRHLVLAAIMMTPLLWGDSLAASPIDFVPPSPRISAIGNPSTYGGDGLTAIFRNPAGFLDNPPILQISELSIHSAGPVKDLVSIIIQGISGDPEAVLSSPSGQSLLQNLYSGLQMVGPVAIGIVGDGVGIALYNGTTACVQESSPLTLNVLLRESAVMAGGFSFNLPFPAKVEGDLYGGCMLKGSLSGEVGTETSYLQLPALLAALSGGAEYEFPFSVQTAMGIDGGVEYRHGNTFSLRIVAQNIISGVRQYRYQSYSALAEGIPPIESITEKLPFMLNCGIVCNPALGRLQRYISDLTVVFDYADMLDFVTRPAEAANPILHASVGVDAVLLERVHIRTGIGEGLLSGGLGIDFENTSLNACVYGMELGIQPGTRPVFGAAAGIELKR